MSIKTAKRKPGKSQAKPKGRGNRPEPEEAPAGPSLLVEAQGLLLLSIALVTLIALVSEFVNPGGGNLLGPFVGAWWAQTLNHFAGSLPVLFLVAAVTLLGFRLVLARGGEEDGGRARVQVRMVIALSLLFVSTSILLSIKNLPKDKLLPSDYQLSGGYLGNFLVQKLFLPVFGRGQFGPYLISSIALLFVLIWGFRLSMVALSEKTGDSLVLVLRPFFVSLSRLWHRPPQPELPPAAAPQPRPGERPAAKERKAKAASERPEPVLSDNAPVTPTAKATILSKENFLGPDGELPEGLEDFDNLDLNDPLIIRKLRDLDLERKRVQELNDWEIKSRSPEIAGLLQKGRKTPEPPPRIVEPAEAESLDAAFEDEDAPLPIAKPKKKKKEAAHAASDVAPETFAKETAADGSSSSLGDVTAAAAEDGAPAVDAVKPEVKYDPYRVPSIDEIFDEPPKQPLEFTEEELREQSKLLEDQLINFKVMGKVTQICPGPVITRYEVELAPGVKVSRIATLADDLALALRAKSIRILAPIPGKSVVGIEVPNRKAQIVYIKEILRASEFSIEEDTLKICVGKTIGGEPYVMDLARAPHLLIAGQTGSGKSVCINSIMASFLCSKTPDELRMILVDPKVVELKPYDNIPHLLYPVITQPDVAVAALKWATVEMDRRYEVLALCGVRNIKGFNAKVREGKLPEGSDLDDADRKILPYMVIIIDELADLMMVAGKEVETNIARIAQKARAVGIHLILATQRPSTNVITGTIKANLPTRIAFQVASQIDARTIMDKMGAEKLLGRGDMLFRPIEFPEPIRLHGCFLNDDQAEKLAGSASNQFVNYPQIQSFSLEDDPSGEGADDGEPRDEKFREAAELVVQVKQASVSLLQRRLGIGYARSGRLVDQLERAGIVGKERGSKPREVLMDPDELQSFLSSGLNDD